MVKVVEPDQVLLRMPSLRAVRSFVAAAKHQNFTRAAEALCVTQAAISRQIRELEEFLGVELFVRTGRAVELTEAGSVFYDAAYLSFINIAQAAERVKRDNRKQNSLTICASPAFCGLWLTPRLGDFFTQYPHLNIDILTTENFQNMEPNVRPDVFINKNTVSKRGYRRIPLFHDVIFPVCSPEYLQKHPVDSLRDLCQEHTLLNLSPYGRAQIAEHIDWRVWFGFYGIDMNERPSQKHMFNANDYSMLVKMALSHQGVSLGWQHLVEPLLKDGSLVRPLGDQVEHREIRHYLSYRESIEEREEFQLFKAWLMDQVNINEAIEITE